MISFTFCRVEVKHFASILPEFHLTKWPFKSFRVTEVREQELQLLLADTILALVQKKQPVKNKNATLE